VSLPLSAGAWTIDPAHSRVGFTVRHLGISTIHGQLNEFAGTVAVGSDLGSSSVNLSAKMASITTASSFRDGHLLTSEILDAETYPDLVFRSTSISEKPGGFALDGELTIRGITKAKTFDVAFHGTGTHPMDNSTRAGFTATGTLDRSEFDAGWGVPMLSDAVQLTLDVQLVGPTD
jgi:polyisoprenoid-binding protein YceI